MTLEERKLTPALGYVFKTGRLDPYESLISILWKFKKANALPGHVVARLMGPDVDPYEGVAPDANSVDVRRLRETLELPIATLRAALTLPSRGPSNCEYFRYCIPCVTRGYHGVLHQLVSVSACPAHRLPMLTACRRCGYEAPYIVRAELLETPYRCANCRRNYGRQGFYPDKHAPMRLDHRIAITRLYYQRCFR